MTAGPHAWPLRVYYEDTDAAGIVYHASYLRFAERGRTEMLRELGFDHRSLADAHGVVFAVSRCVIDFRRPARLDDLLEVRTRPLAVGGARLELEQLVMRGGRTVGQARWSRWRCSTAASCGRSGCRTLSGRNFSHTVD